MITKDDLKIGTELIGLGLGLADTKIIDWGVHKTIFFVQSSNKFLRIEEINEMYYLKPIEEWVDCPIIDISFATKDRVECRVKERTGDNWTDEKLVFIDVNNFTYPFTCLNNKFSICQVKKSDLHKFEV